MFKWCTCIYQVCWKYIHKSRWRFCKLHKWRCCFHWNWSCDLCKRWPYHQGWRTSWGSRSNIFRNSLQQRSQNKRRWHLCPHWHWRRCQRQGFSYCKERKDLHWLCRWRYQVNTGKCRYRRRYCSDKGKERCSSGRDSYKYFRRWSHSLRRQRPYSTRRNKYHRRICSCIFKGRTVPEP